MSTHVGRYADGKLVAPGRLFGGTLGLYDHDGELHYKPRYEKMYYEGEFDDISDEEFEKFKEEMDAKRKKREQSGWEICKSRAVDSHNKKLLW